MQVEFAVDGQVEGVGEQAQGDNLATLPRSRRISRKCGRTRTRPPNPTQPTALSLARQQLVAMHDVMTALAVNDVMSMILNEFCLNASGAMTTPRAQTNTPVQDRLRQKDTQITTLNNQVNFYKDKVCLAVTSHNQYDVI